MRENFNTMLEGTKVRLVPYREKFVEKYHYWMKDPFLLEMTASEPLSIEEEYEMQKNWCNDSNKCTFIILVKNNDSADENNEISNMCGDVNLFLNDIDNKDNAEIEIMIAEAKYRGKGLAKEALSLMMSYGINKIGINRFYAKINKSNEVSIKLFLRLNKKLK